MKLFTTSLIAAFMFVAPVAVHAVTVSNKTVQSGNGKNVNSSSFNITVNGNNTCTETTTVNGVTTTKNC